MSVYQPCDIRGPVAELSPDLYRAWGRILGRQLRPGDAVAVGGDVRTSTPEFLSALAAGFAAARVQVINLDILPTPMIYFAKRDGQHRACAIVTASHNPPSFNGLKWMIDDLPPSEADVAILKKETDLLLAAPGPVPAQQPLLSSRSEIPARLPSALRLGLEESSPKSNPKSEILANDQIGLRYVNWLRQESHRLAPASPHAAPPRSLRVVLDPGNGCWSERALAYLQQVLPGVRATTIHDRADGTFPSRDPDCARPQHLSALAHAVREQHADLGIAFDGDGDRVALVDDQGHVLTAEQATWIFLQSMAGQLGGQRFVYDLKFSDLIPTTARQLGATPVPERSGHAFIRTAMLRQDAAFGAEISGHYFYRDLACGDDGFYSALRLILWLASQSRPLSAWRAECPPIFMTPDLRLPVEASQRQTIIDLARRTFAAFPQTHLDGTRIDFPEGWALIRASVTEPSLTLRFEGKTADALVRVIDIFCKGMGMIGGPMRELAEHDRIKA